MNTLQAFLVGIAATAAMAAVGSLSTWHYWLIVGVAMTVVILTAHLTAPPQDRSSLPIRWFYRFGPPNLAEREFQRLSHLVKDVMSDFSAGAIERLSWELEKLDAWPMALRGQASEQRRVQELDYLFKCMTYKGQYLQMARKTFDNSLKQLSKPLDIFSDLVKNILEKEALAARPQPWWRWP